MMRVKFNFIKTAKKTSLITIVLCMIGIISLFFKGFQPAIEFTGGHSILIANGNQKEIETEFIKQFPNTSYELIQIVNNSESENSLRRCRLTVKNINKIELNEFLQTNQYQKLSYNYISPDIGYELFEKILYGFLIALFIIGIYIAIRFDRHYSVGSIAALFHDVIFTIGVLSLLNINFSIEIVAGILTIIGYSLNDTIIVYDRIRENVIKYSSDKQLNKVDMVNISLSETLTRTMITSVTTLFVVVILFIFGGSSLQPFALCLIIGVFIGTYSSIFIASPIMIGLDKKYPIKELEEEDLL